MDEINWMGSLDASFLGKLKTAWDLYFKKNPRLVLLLSGSMSAWIEKHILRSTGFFGRIALDIVLHELPFINAIIFGVPMKRISLQQKSLRFLVLQEEYRFTLNRSIPKLSAEENIRRLCFRKEGLLFLEFDRIFSEVFGARAPIYKKIVTTLAQGSADQAKIFEDIEAEKGGVYSEYLDELVKTGYLTRDYTWSLKSGKFSKLSLYRLCDNYLRFYLRYIEPNKPNILQNRDLLPPGWTSIMGLQFENLVLNNRQSIQRILGINPAEIKIDNPYFQRGTRNKSGVQIDYLIQTRFNVVYVCEIKFHRDPIGIDIIQEMRKKLKALKLPRGYSARLVLIHVNGVKKELEEQEFFSHIIDFSQLLETN